MADFPFYPAAAALAVSEVTPTVLAGGHTVFAPEAGTYGQAFQVAQKALTAYTFTRELTLNNLIKNIKTAVGWLPPNVTVVGFIVRPDDLDTGGSPTIVQSLYIGDTVVATGITDAQGGTSTMIACLPTTTTTDTALYVNTTTSADTPAAGTFAVTALYYS